MKAILLDEAKKWLEENCENLYTRMAVFGIMQSMPTVDYQKTPNEWVSVEERLPENNAQVLMWSAKWNIAEAGSYYNGRFWVYSEIGDRYIADDITHWMSLPAPPDRRPPENDTESPFENNKSKFMEE